MKIIFFFIRYHQWLTVASQFFHFLDGPDQTVFVVCGKKTLRDLTGLRILPESRLIAIEDFSEILQKHPEAEAEIYVQLSANGLTEFRKYFMNVFAHRSPPTIISFYPDGYTNKFYGEADLRNIAQEFPALQIGKIYQFDVDTSSSQAAKSGLECAIIPSSTIEYFNSVDFIREIARREIERSLIGTKDCDLLVLLMRPWGSESFLKGRLEFGEAPQLFANMLAGLIQQIRPDLGANVRILLRPDARDEDLCRRTITELKEIISSVMGMSIDILVVSSEWPSWLTFDPFIFHFENFSSGSRLHIAGLDSTASLPFVATQKGSTHYFGVPYPCIPPDVSDGDAFRQIKHKLRAMNDFISRLPNENYDLIQIDPSFFKVSRRSDRR